MNPGQRIGHYEILEKLGAGGMGEVFRARDHRLQRSVAIKVLPSGAADPMARRRFEREALTASSLNHPHIITVHEIGEADGQPYLVTEFVDHGTLAEWILAAPRLWRQSVDLMSGIAEGLAAAHAAGILHRDIKPQNILVSRNGYAKLADFGLAVFAYQDADTEAQTVTVLRTQPGLVVGTLAYMSPEHAQGQRLDARSDIFSFGVVLYELLAGRRPFQGQTSAVLVHAIAHDPAPPLPANVPAALGAVVDRALHKDPAQRYQSMHELAVDLRNVEEGAAEARPGPRRTRAALLPVAIGLAVLVGAGWYFTARRDQPAGLTGTIRSVAVLPLKPLVSGGDVDQLGLGVADTVITRIGRLGGVIVRPTSAVRQYLTSHESALDAARQLDVDAVVDGTLQRAGDRVRINMSLLRVSDGVTMWSETYDAPYSAIFETEDRIAAGVMAGLRLRTSSAEQTRLARHHTKSPEAYRYYLRGVATFGSLGSSGQTPIGNLAEGIQWLERAVAIDPGYALAHAQLAWGQMWLGTTGGGEDVVQRARESLGRAEALDATLPETHLVRSLLLYSAFGGYRIVEAVQAVQAAQRTDPNVGFGELGQYYGHVGMIEEAERALRKGIELDPTNLTIRSELPNMYWYAARGDDAIRLNEELGRPVTGWPFLYYISAGRFDEARAMIDTALATDPTYNPARAGRALLLAREGRYQEANAMLPAISPAARLGRTFHHATYGRACVAAFGGNVSEAVTWLDETVKNGLPAYPAFERDTCFDRVRHSAPFAAFMVRLKPVWEGYVSQLRR